MTAMASTEIFASTADPIQSKFVYGCVKSGVNLLCEPTPNKFDSFALIGHTELIQSKTNPTNFEPVDGVFGNALEISGYRLKHLTVPDQVEINPPIFSVSFWMKQDPRSLANSSVISHVNLAKTAGWYFQTYSKNSQSNIQFSVTNTEGKIFSVSASVDLDIFENVVGTFDGKKVKIYLNGFLADSISFAGNYDAEPNVPLNVGLNSFDYRQGWDGLIDEIRLYSRAISDNDVKKLTDYSDYFQSRSSKEEALVAYWPFEVGTQDVSGNHNDGNIILPVVSMVFSPDGRLFYSVKDAGEIRIMMPDGSMLAEPFVRLQDPKSGAQQEIFGITLDPDFPTNHYVYAFTTARDSGTGIFNQVIRFTDLRNNATDKKILVDNIPVGQGQVYSGALAFGPDDKLYITTPYIDIDTPKEHEQNANLTGKVLRINKDGTMPEDNPFPKSPIYTLGHRNSFGIAFDKTTGLMIATENDAHNNDEINVLRKGGNYGFPAKAPQSASAPPAVESLTDNTSSSIISAARTYYYPITPAQALYYDSNKFPTLKGKFLVVSYREGSLYALSINETERLVSEVVIRLPEIQGRIISIAKAPNGDIYIGGQNIYKLISIDRNRIIPVRYFIEADSKDVQINALSLNLSTKVLSIDFTEKNNNSDNDNNNNNSVGNIGTTSPHSLVVRIPKVILGGIYQVTSEKYSNSSNSVQKSIQNFTTKETLRVSNVGDTIVDIKLKSNVGSDKVLVKGQTSSLFSSSSSSAPSGNRIIIR